MKLKSMCIALAVFFICCGLSITFAYADNKGGSNQSEVSGVVSSISGSTITVLNGNMDIDASTAYVKVDGCSGSVNVNNIEDGDIIEAKGTVSNGVFVANKIEIKGIGKLEGVITSVNSGSITILGQTIDITSPYCTSGTLSAGKKAKVYVRDSGSGLTAISIKAK